MAELTEKSIQHGQDQRKVVMSTIQALETRLQREVRRSRARLPVGKEQQEQCMHFFLSRTRARAHILLPWCYSSSPV